MAGVKRARDGAVGLLTLNEPASLNAMTRSARRSGGRASPDRAQITQMTDEHPRNTGPMLASQRCGAKTRSGKPCRSPAVHGKKRCRMHGGAPGSGAPKNNQNALKHGQFTKDAIEAHKLLRALLQQSRKLVQDIE